MGLVGVFGAFFPVVCACAFFLPHLIFHRLTLDFLFKAQMKDWDERERSWNRFRRDYESVRTPKLARRIGGLGRLL